jgi:hypothetical protein
MAGDRKEDEMIYGLTMDERDALQQGLRRLPETPPPRVVWDRIRAQAEAEGLIKRSLTRRPSTWYAMGLAAAVALAVFVAPGLLRSPEPAFPTIPPVATVAAQTPQESLRALQVESRQIESDLRALPDDPRVMRASTAATIHELEERIAAIDYQLNEPGAQLSPDNEEIFWRERVRLMKTLFRLRYAQAQRTAF